MTASTRPMAPVSDRVALSALLVLFLPFAFSEELTLGIVQAAVGEGRRLLISPYVIMAGVDVTLLVVVAIILRKYLRRSAGFGHAVWYIGAALVTLALDLALVFVLFSNSIWFSIGADILWVACLAVFAAIVVNATPGVVVREYWWRAFGESPAWWRFRSVMPLILGTLVAYIAGDIYDLSLSSLVDPAVAGVIDQSYFAEISQIIPLLLVALAVEASFFESTIREPFDRAVAIVTVLMLSVALILTVSALTKSNEQGNVLNVWHEVLAFSLSMEAVCVSLAAIFWGLFINVRLSSVSGDNASEQPIANRSPHARGSSEPEPGVPAERSAGSRMYGERPIDRSPPEHPESRAAESEGPGGVTDDTSHRGRPRERGEGDHGPLGGAR